MEIGSAATTSGDPPWRRVRPHLPTLFTSLLFFLCCADEAFSTRVHGMNFRLGQLFLFMACIATLPGAWRGLRARQPELLRLRPLFVAWGVFFAAYALSAVLSETPLRSGLKLGWGVFNILGAATVCLLNPSLRGALRNGFVVACLLVAGIIWVDALALYWVGTEQPVLGFVQRSFVVDGLTMQRPHAFYYEPSYAGAWLAFAVPVLMVATASRPLWARIALPALPLSAVVLVTSRTGLLSALVALVVVGSLTLIHRNWALAGRLAGTTVLAAALLVGFFQPARATTYGQFIVGPLGPREIINRLMPSEPDVDQTPKKTRPRRARKADRKATQDKPVEKLFGIKLPATSEGKRVSSYLLALRLWSERPAVGWGASFGANKLSVLRPVTINTWLEVLVESGLVGLLAFALAIGMSMWLATRGADRSTVTLLTGAWVAHLVINLNLTQTFPRLDYWLLFFAAVGFALPLAKSSTSPALATPPPPVPSSRLTAAACEALPTPVDGRH